MERISGGLAVYLLTPYWKQFWVERPARGTGKVWVYLAAIVLDESNRNVGRASAFDEALQSLEDLRPVVHRHRRLELVHLGVNNQQHARQDSKWSAR